VFQKGEKCKTSKTMQKDEFRIHFDRWKEGMGTILEKGGFSEGVEVAAHQNAGTSASR